MFLTIAQVIYCCGLDKTIILFYVYKCKVIFYLFISRKYKKQLLMYYSKHAEILYSNNNCFHFPMITCDWYRSLLIPFASRVIANPILIPPPKIPSLALLL